MKQSYVRIRVDLDTKKKWKEHCSKEGITLTSFIINSVEKKIQNNERTGVLNFLDKQGNFFIKVETNINQLAKIVNSQKSINKRELTMFKILLEDVIDLKKEQNDVFRKIYKILK